MIASHLAAVREISARAQGARPRIAVVLGSGWGNLTAQIEQSALSGAKTLEVQAAALVRNVLVSAGIERELVVAVIQGLDRGVAVGRSPEEALAARTSIRQGMMQGLGSHYAELKIALRPLAGGYAGQEAEISRMVDASRTVLLAAVEREAPLASQ